MCHEAKIFKMTLNQKFTKIFWENTSKFSNFPQFCRTIKKSIA